MIAYFALCWVLASQYLSPPRHHAAVIPQFMDDVVVKTRGGDNPTWVTKNFASATTVYVLAFGNGGIRGSFTSLALDLNKHGDAVVIPCMPGQDASPEPTIGFGNAEARTIEDTVAWVRASRPDRPKVILLGVSMGGAASWIAAGMSLAVDGIVSESAYAHLVVTVSQFFNRAIPGGNLLFRPVVWIAQWRSGLRVADINPAVQAAHWKGKPALIIHAGDDNLVSLDQGDELAAATGGEHWVVSGAAHAGCYEHDPKAYVERLVAFANAITLAK